MPFSEKAAPVGRWQLDMTSSSSRDSLFEMDKEKPH
jgi:hypothetical protein